MARSDTHLDAMLRHLGAAYYESLHGRATRTDVARALDTVEDHLAEHGQRKPAHPDAAGKAERTGRREAHHQPGRWKRRVQDVMTTKVVTVDRITPYKEIARLLAEHHISGMPVLTMGRYVAGVVSEGDLLVLEDAGVRRDRMRTGGWRLRRSAPHWGMTAGELMTAPAVTVQRFAPIPSAARLMNTHHVRRLPVVDDDGKLIGIVSRSDLLSVFLRPDPGILADVRELLDEVLHADGGIKVVVRDGRVILTGVPDPETRDLVPVAIRLIWDIDGVVDVVSKLGEQAEATGRPPRWAAGSGDTGRSSQPVADGEAVGHPDGIRS